MMKMCRGVESGGIESRGVENRGVGNKSVFRLFMSVIPILVIVLMTSHHVSANDKNIKWSEGGDTYRLTPIDNTITEKDYTIKAVNFPPPVRGERTIDGGVRPERPTGSFVEIELYKDIINNTNPIGTFGLGINDEYITPNKDLRITISDIPSSISQDWVYEYYNPWATIRVQTRSVPNLDIQITLTDYAGNSIDEDNIKSGDNIKASIKIRNTGDDTVHGANFVVAPDSQLLKNVIMTNTLKDYIYQLNEDEEKTIDVSLKAPVSLEDMSYNIDVNITGYDAEDVEHSFSTSKIIKVGGEIESIYVEKSMERNTTYLKEYAHVILSVVNRGHMTMSNIQVHDTIPYGLVGIKDNSIYNDASYNFTDIVLNRSYLGPSDSWEIAYKLKPVKPGIYVLPKFEANFSVGGKYLSTTSSEVGFRVFGPKVILNKSAIDMGNGVLQVVVKAKNVGNGFTKIVIKDQLPDNATLMLGEMSLSTSLDVGVEKYMSYTIKVPYANIAGSMWPPARADYYLDDWRFTVSSDEKYDEDGRVEDGRSPQEGTKTHIVILTPAGADITLAGGYVTGGEGGTVSRGRTDIGTYPEYPETTVPKIEEEKKRVVATIPASKPTVEKKSAPGFESYESILLFAILVLLNKCKSKK